MWTFSPELTRKKQHTISMYTGSLKLLVTVLHGQTSTTSLLGLVQFQSEFCLEICDIAESGALCGISH